MKPGLVGVPPPATNSAICTFCLGSFSRGPGAAEDERAQQYAGMAASASTAIQYASPLADLVKVGAEGGR